MVLNEDKLTKLIFRRLLRKNKIGAAHTDIDNVVRGVRGDLRGLVRKLVVKLIKTSYILTKKTPYGSGLHVSLNPAKIDEITKILEEDNTNKS